MTSLVFHSSFRSDNKYRNCVIFDYESNNTIILQKDYGLMTERFSSNQLGIGPYNPLMEKLPSPLLSIDGNLQVLWANQAARKLFGGLPDGRCLDDLIDVDAEELKKIRAESRNDSSDKPHLIVKQGRTSVRELEIRFVHLPSVSQQNDSSVVVIYDLTPHTQLDKTRADFIANASHELRTPLASLVGFIETLQGPAKDDVEAREQFLSIMADQTRRMTRLVEDLMSLSKIEMNEYEAPDDSVELGSLLKGVASSLAIQAQAKRVDIKVTGDLEKVVIGDFDQIEQIFFNLIENAIKYGDEDSTVLIDVVQVDLISNMIGIKITDQGHGIPKKYLDRLTERFFRVDKARSRSLGGTGLGLAIVKHIINRHRGHLLIDSEEGVGSTFEVRLPLKLAV